MTERITRGKAIRLKCLDCCCGSALEVRRCESTKCPLWRFRMGRETQEENGTGARVSENREAGRAKTQAGEGSP